MLPREYAIKWSFLSHLFQLVSLHYMGKDEPRKCIFSVTLADNAAGVQEQCRASSHCSAHSRDRSVSWLATPQWTLFVREEDEVDSMFQKQCRYRDTVYSMIEKTQFWVHVSPCSAQTLVRRSGIKNDHLIIWSAYSVSNISAENYQNRLMCVKVIVCNINVVFWDTV